MMTAMPLETGVFVIGCDKFTSINMLKQRHKDELFSKLISHNLRIIHPSHEYKITYKLKNAGPIYMSDELYSLKCKVELVKGIKDDKSYKFSNFVTASGDFEDPVTFDPIKSEWMQGPRFIKLGSYLLTLESFLSMFFRKECWGDKIMHPIENRALSDLEEASLLRDLSDLFMVHPDMIKKCFIPFGFQEEFIACEKQLSESMADWQVLSPEYRNEQINEIIFEAFLKSKISTWDDMTFLKIVLIKHQVKEDLFRKLRLLNFLMLLPESILDVEIYSNPETCFTLRKLYEQAQGGLEVTF